MGYNKTIATIKWWDPYTKKLKYCPPAKFDKHKNKFGKRWSPRSALTNGTNIYDLQTINFYLSDQTFIKYYMFEETVNFPPRGNPIGIVYQCFEHHNMSYVSQ